MQKKGPADVLKGTIFFLRASNAGKIIGAGSIDFPLQGNSLGEKGESTLKTGPWGKDGREEHIWEEGLGS